MHNTPSPLAWLEIHEKRLQKLEEVARHHESAQAATVAYQKSFKDQVEKMEAGVNQRFLRLEDQVQRLEESINDKIDSKVDGAVERIVEKVDEIKQEVVDLKGRVDNNSERIEVLEDQKKEKSAWNDVYRKIVLLLVGAAASQAIPRLIQFLFGD